MDIRKVFGAKGMKLGKDTKPKTTEGSSKSKFLSIIQNKMRLNSV